MAASPSDRGSGRAIIIVLVVLVVAALAGVGYLIFDRQSSTEADAPSSSAASTTPAAPTSSAPPAGTTVTHSSGAFSVVLPDNGWQTKSDGTSQIAEGAPVIQFAPDLDAYAKGTGKISGFAIADLSKSSTSPAQYVATAQESNFDGCAFSKPKVFDYKGSTGTFVDRKACSSPASDGSVIGFDAIQLGVTKADGTKVGMVIRDLPGETSTRQIALEALDSLTHT